MNQPEAPQPGMPDAAADDSYLTLDGSGSADLKIQRSRFVALATAIDDSEAAHRFLASQARRYHDSRHVCHAWRLGAPPKIVEIRNDDGEPSGTAGEPILAEIRKRDLTQTAVVVVRYFGGIKLGTGGLARAYGQAAAEALDAAATRRVRLGRMFSLAFPYERQKTLRHLLVRHEGEIRHEVYTAEVAWHVWLPHSAWRACGEDLREATAGTVQLVPLPAPKK